MENKKLSKEELEQIQEVQQRSQLFQNELGRLEAVKLEIQEKRQELIEYNKETVKKERNLAKELEEAYGKGSIDLDKGEFIPSQEEEK